MNMTEIRHFFVWCAMLNYAVLILWFVISIVGRSFLLGICRRFFRISEETYDNGMFYGIMSYKLAIFVFALMPYIALKIMKYY